MIDLMNDICLVFEKHKQINGIVSFIKEIKPVMLRYSKTNVQLNEKLSDFIIQIQNDPVSASFEKTIQTQYDEMSKEKKQQIPFVFKAQDFQKSKPSPRLAAPVEHELKPNQKDSRTEREDQTALTQEALLFEMFKAGESQIDSVPEFIDKAATVGCVFPDKIKGKDFKTNATAKDAWKVFNLHAKVTLQI